MLVQWLVQPHVTIVDQAQTLSEPNFFNFATFVHLQLPCQITGVVSMEHRLRMACVAHVGTSNTSEPTIAAPSSISLTPHYHFHLLHRHLDISRVITAESLHLPIDSSWI